MPLTLSGFPLHFEPNRGQARADAVYVARNGRNLASFTRRGAVFTRGANRMEMTLLGSRERVPEAENVLAGRSNYLLPERSIVGVPHFAGIRYGEVYRGIDLVFHGADAGLEYDFAIAPGADPAAIRLRFAGAKSVVLDGSELVAKAGELELRHRAPVAYQEIGGVRHTVEAAYRVRDGEVGFTVGAYDRSRALVIDPVLVYATYFGGSGTDSAEAVMLDASGNAVIAGTTTSADLPVTTAQTVSASMTSAGFVAKLDAKSNVIFATYFAIGSSTVAGAALDSASNIVIAGFGSGTAPGFVMRISAAGDKVLSTSTFNGYPSAVALDLSGNIYVTGNTFGNLATTAGVVQPASGGGTCSDTPAGIGTCSDAFVLKLSADGSKVMYATNLGGNLEDSGLAIAVDATGAAYITGNTVSTNFPLSNAAQKTFAPIQQVFGYYAEGHAFVAKLSPDASTLVYSTLLGGSAPDVGNAIAIDAAGNAFVAGSTASADFPVTAGAYQTKYDGPTEDPTDPISDGDAFVVKYSPAGAVVWSTLLGGSALDTAVAIAIDSLGNLYVAGNTGSTDFPTTTDGVPSCRRSTGPFVAELDPTGSRLERSTLLSGMGYDLAGAMTLDKNSGIVYVAGSAESQVFFAVGTAAQKTYAGGNSDAFLAKLDWNNAPVAYVACVLNAASFQPGNLTSFPLGTVAPGEIVSIFGVGLGPATAVTSPTITAAGVVATTLGGTQVFFDGVAAPLLYVGPSQINAVVPYEVKSTGSKPVTQMTVQSAAGSYGPVTMPVAAAVPAIFTYDGSGIGQAAAINQDGTFNTAANPATRGQIVTFYLTGAGAMNPAMADGSLAAAPYPQPQLPVSVTVRGVTATVQYAGAAPGYVSGLMQINVYIPTTVNFGSDVPLLVNIGTFNSQYQVSLAVQ